MDLAAGIQSVVDAFAAVSGIDSATTDAAQLGVPGALVQLAELEPLTLGSWLVTTQVVLVVPDSDGGPGPVAAFATLLSNMLAAGIQPDGPIVARSVQLPSSPAPLPGLLVPITVRIPA
jgi:hypothetical protein